MRPGLSSHQLRGCLCVPSRISSGFGAKATATQSKRNGTPMPVELFLCFFQVQGTLQAADKAAQHQEESRLQHEHHGAEDMWIASAARDLQCYPAGPQGWSTSLRGAAPSPGRHLHAALCRASQPRAYMQSHSRSSHLIDLGLVAHLDVLPASAAFTSKRHSFGADEVEDTHSVVEPKTARNR